MQVNIAQASLEEYLIIPPPAEDLYPAKYESGPAVQKLPDDSPSTRLVSGLCSLPVLILPAVQFLKSILIF